jgi:ribosomal protein S18 acetylase RimI-like enzyme
MRITVEDFKDPFARQPSVAIFGQFFHMNVVDADKWIEGYMKKPDAAAIVAKASETETMGFCIAARATADDPWYASTGLHLRRQGRKDPWMVMEVHVSPLYRRMKVATSLLTKISSLRPLDTDSMILGVDARNIPARKLYEKCGWRFNGVIFKPPGFLHPQMLLEHA